MPSLTKLSVNKISTNHAVPHHTGAWPFHLFRYLDEQVFRYNNRATKKNFVSDSHRFEMAFPQIADKRLTYDELIGRRFEQP